MRISRSRARRSCRLKCAKPGHTSCREARKWTLSLRLNQLESSVERDAKCCSRRSMMAQELVLSLHGIGTPHDRVGTEESFYWVTREAFTMLLENIVGTRAT